MSIEARVAAYLRGIGPAIEGSGGDERTYRAVLACYAFGLSEVEALAALRGWNATCQPPWSERDLQTKIGSVYRRTRLPPGFKLDEEAEDRPPRPPRYPENVGAYMSYCFGSGEPGPRFLAWARARGFTPEQVAAAGAHQVFIDRRSAPGWDALWPPGYDVLCPLWDPAGEPRSMRARWSGVEDDPIAGCIETPAPKGAKALPPRGFDAAGLVLANARGAIMLRTGLCGRHAGGRFYPDDEPTNVWIVEGEPDLLTLTVALAGRKDDRSVVLGLFSGAWTWEHAKRIPVTATVVLATHDDLQGRKYAEEVQESVYGRVAGVRRYVPRRGER